MQNIYYEPDKFIWLSVSIIFILLCSLFVIFHFQLSTHTILNIITIDESITIYTFIADIGHIAKYYLQYA